MGHFNDPLVSSVWLQTIYTKPWSGRGSHMESAMWSETISDVCDRALWALNLVLYTRGIYHYQLIIQR